MAQKKDSEQSRSLRRRLKSRMSLHVDYYHEVAEVHRLASIGIQRLARSGPLTEALRDLDRKAATIESDGSSRPDEAQADQAAEANYQREMEMAAEAEKRASDGNTMLNAHSSVALWGLVEAFVEDAVHAMVCELPAVLSTDAKSAKLKIEVGEFLAMSNEDRAWLLVRRLQESKGNGLAGGIGSRLFLLSCVGIDPQLSGDTRKTLSELSHVRNVLVHRAGVADDRLVANCPWLEATQGERIVVTPARLTAYFNAVSLLISGAVRSSASVVSAALQGTAEAQD